MYFKALDRQILNLNTAFRGNLPKVFWILHSGSIHSRSIPHNISIMGILPKLCPRGLKTGICGLILFNSSLRRIGSLGLPLKSSSRGELHKNAISEGDPFFSSILILNELFL